MPQPILVYLDTSDFANFAKHPMEPRHKQVFDYLAAKVSNKEIVVPFSFFHIVELIRDFDIQHIASRAARAEIVMRLSSGNALRFLPLNSTDFLSNEGEWFPDIDFSSQFEPSVLRGKLADILNEELVHRGIPRNKRRLFIKGKNLREIIELTPISFDNELVKDLILPPLIRQTDFFKNLFLGKISAQEAGSEIKKIFCDLTMLVPAIAHLRDGRLDLSPHVTAMFKSYDTNILNARNAIHKGRELVQTLDNESKKLLEEGFSKNHALIQNVKELAKQTEASLRLTDSLAERLAPLNEFSPGHAERVAAYIRSNLRDARQMKESDVGDIFHSAYLPVVDLWRGDRWFSDMLRRENVADHSKVIGDISDLPSRIEALLMAR